MARHAATRTFHRTRRCLIVRRARVIAVAALTAAAVSSSAEALEARVIRLRITGTRLWTAIELRDLLRDNFLKLVQEGRAVFVQVQADVWQDRRMFDRIVISTPPVTFRVDRSVDGRGVLVSGTYGESAPHPDVSTPLSLRVDLGPAERIEGDGRYYLHAVVTAATVDEREIEEAGQAIFGEDPAGGLAGLGRFVFRTLLRMGKYFESATAEVTSRRVTGREIVAGVF